MAETETSASRDRDVDNFFSRRDVGTSRDRDVGTSRDRDIETETTNLVLLVRKSIQD